MADIEQQTPVEEVPADDVDMGEGGDAAAGAGEDTGLTEMEPEAPKLVLFAELMKSPIVEVVVGSGEERSVYSAHEAILVKAPEFARQIEQFAPGGPRQVFMADVDVDAMGSVIEYLYTGEYFPKKTTSARDAPLEKDPRQPTADDEGLGLLAHAKVYTLADRLALPDLKSLAHSKIHRTASTAKGELAYARYVYKESNPERQHLHPSKEAPGTARAGQQRRRNPGSQSAHLRSCRPGLFVDALSLRRTRILFAKPTMPLSSDVTKKLQETVETACANATSDIPGLSVVAVGKDGKELFAHAAGKRGVASSEPMTLDNVFWIASCTKMVAGIACMQLVEQRKLHLDDGDELEKLCPELKSIKVLQNDGTLVEKNKKITLRMLLTHTAGFGYSFFNERLRDFSAPVGFDEFSGNIKDIMQPLVHQPGEGWEYSVGVDWAGLALERATGMSLNDYMHKNIFQPLGLKHISMFPTEEMKRKLAYMHQRRHDGSLIARDHLLRRPLVVDASEASSVLNSGGAGCFSTPSDYCQIIAMLLNDGTSPTTGARILNKDTVDDMFTNQIPNIPNFARQGIPDAKPDLTNPIPEIYPVPGDPPQGWGLTFMLSNGGITGRSKSTGFWAGLPNCWWWCDREKGVGGLVCSQILPFADAKVLGTWFDIETQIYNAL